MRLYAFVEGQSEEAFVGRLLGPHLDAFGVTTTPIVVVTARDRARGRVHRGGGRWSEWQRTIRNDCRSKPGNAVRFTTMFDLYGLPSDLPGADRLADIGDAEA